ncbi:helix-turn-helix domain-containing protein [Streptomyces minutiscleroticus]|nr:helix-turn-helix domain-containing protein [Streptomyces minutiscleroticus]
MMPEDSTTRHTRQAQDRVNGPEDDSRSHGAFTLIQAARDHEAHTTASRQLRRPGEYLDAVRYMVRHHPRATQTTIRLAEALAARMPRGRHGHIPFCVDTTARELGLKRRTVLYHARYLRELGLLVYVEHGSRRNVMRTRHGANWTREHGYRGTATIFAPVAPRAWDDARGHRIRGQGYTARLVGYTAMARSAAGNARTPCPDTTSACTPSVMPPQPRISGAGGRENKDSTRRPASRTSNRSHRPKGTTGWTAGQTAAAISDARFVQLHTWWTQGACVRQLAYALRPLIHAGWNGSDIARELARWTVPLRPRDVAAYVASEIRRRANTGTLYLPDGLVTPYRQPAVSTWDDNETPFGPRYARMQAWKERAFRPAAARAASALQQMRQALAARPGRRPRAARPNGVPGAHPENVRLTRAEIDTLMERSAAIPACTTLWDETEQAAEQRVEREGHSTWWEYAPSAATDPFQ